MATAVAPPKTAPVTTSVDPLYTQAVAQAQAALKPQVQTIQNEQAAADAQAASSAKDATDVGAALSKLLQPIGPAVNSMYQTAAQNQELAGAGFSDGMKDALQGNTDSLNAMLQKLGQPVTLDSHANEAGDALYAMGGFNPGTAFSKAGAAFGSAAELQAGDAILRGQQNAESIKATALQNDVGFQNKIAELASKLPGDVQTNYAKLQSLALQNKRFELAVHNAKFSQAMAIAKQKLSVAKYNTSVDEFNARQKLDYAKFARMQYQQDRMYQVSLAHLGVAERNAQLRATAAAFKQAHGGYTQPQLTKLSEQANAIANTAFHGATRYATQTVNGVKSSVPVHTGGVSYFEALGQMLKRGIPVQTALSSLDRVYPTNLQPTPEALQKELGPLAPAAITAQVANDKNALGAASVGMTNPTALLTNGASLVVNVARQMLGTPYQWGGTTPGKALDCSGFVQQVYRQIGVPLPRTTQAQVKVGKPVALQQLQPGDLVFTEPGKNGPNHVGIYIGNGQVQESPHTGDVNKVIPLPSFLGGGFVAARRILPGY